MAFITVNVGEVLLLKYMLGATPASNVKLRLFTNNITPSESDTLSMYTESAAAGYTPIALPGTSWTYATTSGTSYAAYARQTFSYGTSEVVHGYYLTNLDESSDDELIWAEKFTDGPYNVPNGGGTINVDPKIFAD